MAIAAFLAAFGLAGCISDSFTTSPSDLLEFSESTVSFDTVFTEAGTPTARLKVYNRAKKGLSISRIAFREPTSRFQLNVDGVSGTEFHDVEIRGGDSIFVFIECYIPEQPGNEPQLVTDQLDFLTNGVTQSVAVEAWGQNVKRLRGLEITEDMTLTADIPYVVYDSLAVAEGALLRIEPDVRLLFHDKARLSVRGRLEAVGEPGKMIQMRGDRLDNVLPDVGYDILAGQWEGVRIGRESFGNRLEYVDMRSTVSGLRLDSCGVYDRPKLTVVNSWLHNSQNEVLTAPYCRTESYGVCYSDAGGAVVRLTGGSHVMSQCTLANEYLFAIPRQAILTLEHWKEDPDAIFPSDQPPMEAEFGNCVIYGMASDIDPGDLTGGNVFLRRCSLRAAGTDDVNFLDCLWDCDPLFLTVRQDYVFNYRVQPDSPVIGQGWPELVARQTLTDMTGAPRLANGAPTLGAYAE